MKHVLVRFPDETGALLDQKRREGYSVTGFIRHAVAKALKQRNDRSQPVRRRKIEGTR